MGWIPKDTSEEGIIIPIQYLKSWGVIGENFPNIDKQMFDAKSLNENKLVEENIAAVKNTVKQIKAEIKGESEVEKLRQKLIKEFCDVFWEKLDKDAKIKMVEVKLELKEGVKGPRKVSTSAKEIPIHFKRAADIMIQ